MARLPYVDPEASETVRKTFEELPFQLNIVRMVAHAETCLRPMLRLLGKHASARKFRLFGCACCRRLWDMMRDEHAHRAVELFEAFADKRGLKPIGRLIGWGISGCDPDIMGIGPAPAIRKAFERHEASLKDFDLFEVNEAFAPVVLAWARETGASLERTNVNGGAIALGHPLGATGARLMTTLLHELERRDARYGLETMCCGGGLGTATLVDRSVV